MQAKIKHTTVTLFLLIAMLILLTVNVGYKNKTVDLQANWILDIEMAKEKAAEENKAILISFAGSDWCKPCIILTNEVFKSENFSLFADESLILVLADFPRYKKNRLSPEQMKKNEKLAKKYNNEGAFPLVVLVDAEGKVLAKPTYNGEGAEKYITHLKTLLENQQ